MSVSIRQSSRARDSGSFAIRPSVLVTILFLGAEWVVYVLTMTTTLGAGAGIYASRSFVVGSQIVSVLLAVYVCVDCWRGYRTTGRAGAVLIAALAVVALLTHVWVVRSFGALAAP